MWSDRGKSVHGDWSCFIFVPSFVKLSQMVSKLKSGHDFFTENYKGESYFIFLPSFVKLSQTVSKL